MRRKQSVDGSHGIYLSFWPEAEWHLRGEAEGYFDPPERLATVQARITDITRMLEALGTRFARL